MIKSIIQIFMLILLILMVLLTFAACSNKETDTDNTAMSLVETDDMISESSLANLNTTDAQNTSKRDITSSVGDSIISSVVEGETSSEVKGSTSVNTGILPEESNDIDNSFEEKPNNKMIAIDAGHQRQANNEKEPIGPGASTMKVKVSSGTQGSYTGVPEYKLNLIIAKKVKGELLDRGYEVSMIRETNDVNLSNRERAEMANESGADVFIRIHADSFNDSSAHGASTLYPSEDNPYVSLLSEDSHALSKAIIDAICENTGAKNRGAIARDDMSGINWCKIPVSIIEMGYLSNEEEDKLMQTEEYQDKIVQGICDGIDAYFE